MTIKDSLTQAIDAVNGCHGYFVAIIDGEPQTDCSHQWHQSPDKVVAFCQDNNWENVSIGFIHSHLGYSDYSDSGLIGLSNFRAFLKLEDPNDSILEVGYGWNGAGICVDLNTATDEILETIQSLDSYPLVSEEEHSDLECEVLESDWQSQSIAERFTILKDLGLNVWLARHDDAPFRGDCRLWEYILENANQYATAYA